MADPSTPTFSPISGSPLRSSPQRIIYHTNSQTRINEILENARQRSIAMDLSQSFPAPVSPLSSPRTARLPEHEGEGTESSADERTAIVRRQNSKRTNYRSTRSSVSTRNSEQVTRRSRQEHYQTSRPECSDTDDSHPWWRKQVEKIGSIELENKGSVARDHLALERTFLAWLRTSLAFASIGIAVTQLFRLNASISNNPDSGNDPFLHLRQLGKPLGATFLGISIVVLFIGFHRYFESQHWIIKGKFPASRGSVALITAIALALMASSLIVVLVVEPSEFEKRRR